MNLETDLLDHRGGIDKNSLIKILNSDTDEESLNTEIIKHSPYYDANMFISLLKDKKNIFSIFSTNIESIGAKFTEFEITLKELGHSFSVICLQETWLTDQHDTTKFNLDGYKLIPQGRVCSQKGGLFIYKKMSYNIRSK